MEKVTRISLFDQPLFRVFFDIKNPRVGGRWKNSVWIWSHQWR